MTLKEANEIFPLKSGMCVELFNGVSNKKLILFQYGAGELCYYDTKSCGWDRFNYYLLSSNKYDRIKVYQSPTVCSIYQDIDKIFDSGDYTVKELTMQEIADKFGVKVENLRIKE